MYKRIHIDFKKPPNITYLSNFNKLSVLIHLSMNSFIKQVFNKKNL